MICDSEKIKAYEPEDEYILGEAWVGADRNMPLIKAYREQRFTALKKKTEEAAVESLT